MMNILKRPAPFSFLVLVGSRHLLAYASAAGQGNLLPLLGSAMLATDAETAFDGEGHKYSLRVDATLPYEDDWQTSGLTIDRCVEWMGDANGDNFTWYGLRIQLPDDGVTGSGGRYVDVTRATQELGWTQNYNATPPATILEYNITMGEEQPTIRVNFNDRAFWDAYKFDFADGSDYQEFKQELNGWVSCYGTPANETRRFILTPVIPTLTISLLRFDEGGTPATPSPTPSSAAGTLRGRYIGLGVVVASSYLARAF